LRSSLPSWRKHALAFLSILRFPRFTINTTGVALVTIWTGQHHVAAAPAASRARPRARPAVCGLGRFGSFAAIRNGLPAAGAVCRVSHRRSKTTAFWGGPSTPAYPWAAPLESAVSLFDETWRPGRSECPVFHCCRRRRPPGANPSVRLIDGESRANGQPPPEAEREVFERFSSSHSTRISSRPSLAGLFRVGDCRRPLIERYGEQSHFWTKLPRSPRR